MLVYMLSLTRDLSSADVYTHRILSGTFVWTIATRAVAKDRSVQPIGMKWPSTISFSGSIRVALNREQHKQSSDTTQLTPFLSLFQTKAT